MSYIATQPVRFRHKGKVCTGIVEKTEGDWVFLRSNDTGHEWATLLVALTRDVWEPGERMDD